MEEEVKKSIRKRTTEELLEAIAQNQDQYTEEAIVYMIEVLKQRGIPLSEIQKRRLIYENKIIKLKQQEEKLKEDKNWMEVKNFPSRLFAEQAKGLLESNGIISMIRGEDIGIIGPGAGFGTSWPHGISLRVSEDNYHDAKMLIETFFNDI